MLVVYALGYEYAAKKWAVRLGYNYAKSPIAEQDGSKGITNPANGADNFSGAVKNFFNLSGFPGIVETHYTIGGGYNISDSLAIDGSFIYVPEVSASFDTSAMTEGLALGAGNGAAATTGASTADVTHSQMALTLAMSYKF